MVWIENSLARAKRKSGVYGCKVPHALGTGLLTWDSFLPVAPCLLRTPCSLPTLNSITEPAAATPHCRRFLHSPSSGMVPPFQASLSNAGEGDRKVGTWGMMSSVQAPPALGIPHVPMRRPMAGWWQWTWDTFLLCSCHQGHRAASSVLHLHVCDPFHKPFCGQHVSCPIIRQERQARTGWDLLYPCSRKAFSLIT